MGAARDLRGAARHAAYAAGQAFGPHGPITDHGAMVMSPDLVAVPGGIADPTNKVVVTADGCKVITLFPCEELMVANAY